MAGMIGSNVKRTVQGQGQASRGQTTMIPIDGHPLQDSTSGPDGHQDLLDLQPLEVSEGGCGQTLETQGSQTKPPDNELGHSESQQLSEHSKDGQITRSQNLCYNSQS